MYRHTQRSRSGPLTAGGMCLVLLPLAWGAPLAIQALMLAVLGVLAWCGWTFRQMTVEVADGELRAWFGGGWPRYGWPLERIDAVQKVHTSFWDGTGIRFTRHGLLYNVASGPGIEFRLKSGATFRLGSDDAEGLARALASAAGIAAPDAEPTAAVAPGRTLSTRH